MYGHSQVMPFVSPPKSQIGTIGQMMSVSGDLFQQQGLSISDGFHGGGSLMVAEPGSSRSALGASFSRTSTPVGHVPPGRHGSQGTINRSNSPPRSKQPRNPMMSRRRLPNVKLEAHHEKTEPKDATRPHRIQAEAHISMCSSKQREHQLHH